MVNDRASIWVWRGKSIFELEFVFSLGSHRWYHCWSVEKRGDTASWMLPDFSWAMNILCLVEKCLQNKGCPRGASGSLSPLVKSVYIYIYISIYPQKREDPRENRERLPIQRAKEPLSRVFFFLGRRNALQFMGLFCSLILASRMKWICSKCWIESLLYYWCTDRGLHWSPGLAPFPLLSIIIRICCGCAVSGSLLFLSPVIVRIIYVLAAPDSTSSFSPLTTSRWHTAVRKAWKKKKKHLVAFRFSCSNLGLVSFKVLPSLVGSGTAQRAQTMEQ